MRTINLHLVAALAAVLFCAAAAGAQPRNMLDVTVAGDRNADGVVKCVLYASPGSSSEPGKQFRRVAASIRYGIANCVFTDLPPGSYAVAAVHTEQNVSPQLAGVFGKPRPGFGFSRNPYSMVGPPSFADAAFEYRGGYQGQFIRLAY